MYGNKKTGGITFYYDSESVFDEVGMLSAYMAKNLSATTGVNIDEFTVTEDERNLYEDCLKRALPKVYNVFLKISDPDDPFNADAKVDAKENSGLEREAGTYIEINIKDNGAYSINTLGCIDGTLINCIKFAVLAEYYSVNINADLLRLSNDRFVETIQQLDRFVFSLRKKKVSVSYPTA